MSSVQTPFGLNQAQMNMTNSVSLFSLYNKLPPNVVDLNNKHFPITVSVVRGQEQA